MTGGTSFLGKSVLRELLRGGHEVIALIRPLSMCKLGAEVIRQIRVLPGDMSDIEAVGKQLREERIHRFDACIHLAWSGVGADGRMNRRIQDENVRATLNLLRFSADCSCGRFLFSGSQAEYGVTMERVQQGLCSGAPIREEAVCRPISEYGKAKLRVWKEASSLAAERKLRYCHLRIFSLYGSGDHETTLISTAVRGATAGEVTTFGPCRQQWDFLHVDDCARALVRLTEEPLVPAERKLVSDREPDSVGSSVYNIGSGQPRPLCAFVREVFALANRNPETYCRFAKRPAGPEGTPYLMPDCSKLREAIGWRPEISFEAGIRGLLEQAVRMEKQE